MLAFVPIVARTVLAPTEGSPAIMRALSLLMVASTLLACDPTKYDKYHFDPSCRYVGMTLTCDGVGQGGTAGSTGILVGSDPTRGGSDEEATATRL
jgi:hypothetical protein